MDQEYANLVAAVLAFVGTHFAMSHPLRRGLVKALGAGGFQGVYSLVSLATFAWIVFAFRAIPLQGDLPWDGSGTVPWAIATVLMLAASVLLVGSFMGNPALPQPNAKALAEHRPKGVFLITRHPMMWSFALWSLSHVLVSPAVRVMILAGAIAFLALVGAHMQDRKKEVLMGEAWARWEHRTSYWPNLAGFAKAGAIPWVGGAALWLAATWAHIPAIMMPAGVWRWLI
ncbi:MAG: NnrU family protein [Novosphingobium sp.]